LFIFGKDALRNSLPVKKKFGDHSYLKQGFAILGTDADNKEPT
jgi:hypothetical protein